MVVGPGLGRNPAMLETAKRIIGFCKEQNMPLILDADGLMIVNKDPSIIEGYDKVPGLRLTR
eukprot:scaffold194877_cov46-Prasinocladus_malaysianus.AAC.1